MVCFHHAMDHDRETSIEIKVLQEMNPKCGLNPDIGVDKLKKEHNHALKAMAMTSSNVFGQNPAVGLPTAIENRFSRL